MALNDTFNFLDGGGEMGEMIRSTDWSLTPIGDVSGWPISLRISVGNMLSTPFPTYIAWGKEYIQLYNDGYRPILGSLKHPAAVGISTRETFSEIWHIIGPMFDGVMKGNAVGFPNFMLPLNRNGFVEECFFDFSYSPIKDESGVIGGVLVTVIEITEKVNALKDLNDLKNKLEQSAAQLSFERNMLDDLFEQVPAGICILGGPDLVYEFINPFYQQFFPDRELLGKPLYEAIPEIKNQPISDIIEEVYATGETFEGHELLIPLAKTSQSPIEDRYFDFIYRARKKLNGEIDGIFVFVIEVTESVKAKERSKTREKLLEELIMNAKYGLLILRGEQWICEIANQPIAEMWRKDLTQIIGNPLLEVLPEIKDQPFPELLRRVFETGQPYREEEEVFLLDTNEGPVKKYVNFAYDPIIDNVGKVSAIIVSANDITDKVKERGKLEESYTKELKLNEQLSIANADLVNANIKLAEAQESLKHLLKNIADSESKFRNIIKQAPVAIGIYTGLDLIIDIYNDKILEFWGRTANQVKNKPLFEAIPEARGQGYEQLLLNVFKTGKRFIANELPVTLMRNGVLEEVWINFIYDPVKDLNGSITGVIAVSNEVTDQVNSRKELQRALEQIRLSKEAAQLGTFDMDMEKGTMHWDDRCRTLFGISHNGKVSYELDFINGLHPDDRDRVLKVIENVFKKEVSDGDYDVEYRTVGFEDQKLRWVRAKGKAYFNLQNEPVRFIGSVLDITEQKLDELRKNDFIGMVSHELKTPLTTLTAVVQVTKSKLKNADDPFLKTAMQTADSQVRKMGNLITGFLNVSKLDAGKILITKQDFLIDRLIQEIIEESRLTSTTHSIHISPCDPVNVYADRDKIGSVISNLINNAIKYSPKGNNIHVKCELIANNVQVSVEDEGMGIKPKDINHLFDRYYRVESKHTAHISGFGIGLYLSSEIIKQHHGKIWVESEIGIGSTFYFTIPINK
ncbi:PAS domain-containing protein [Mucilaginibacter sp.]|uniref:PAS domain-containing protein n=1 Tax=Mucilaginibacter sp. TaxID=1882438 RepID=UPI003D0F4E01